MTQSTNFTFTVAAESAWQVIVPVKINNPNTGNMSAGAQIYVYRSTDSGRTFDNVALMPIGLARPTAAQVQQVSLKLESGTYAIQVTVPGGVASTFTVQILTQQVLTSVLNQ